jgi:hypothetical protein
MDGAVSIMASLTNHRTGLQLSEVSSKQLFGFSALHFKSVMTWLSITEWILPEYSWWVGLLPPSSVIPPIMN